VNVSLEVIQSTSTVGGAFCLDFCNAEFAGAPYSALLEWAQDVGVLTESEADSLDHVARQHPRRALDALRHTEVFQHTAREVFAAITDGQAPGPTAAHGLLDAFASAARAARLTPSGGTVAMTWDRHTDLHAVHHIIANDAVRLLAAAPTSRIRRCQGCSWFFVDTSRNRSRRWCSMDTCGARDKMRRYHQRNRTTDHGAR
jgi:predicted RNA-binding Zn ribbon-like protein